MAFGGMKLGGIWKAGSGATRVDPAITARIRDWTRAILALDDDATVSVNEIICADPACPGSETVILVMIPGRRTKAYKVAAAMAEATEAIVKTALSTAA